MPKINISNKTLKLVNVVSCSIDGGQFQEIDQVPIKMENYIRSKGYIPIGPIIQHVGVADKNENIPEVTITILRQSNGYINHIDLPYKIESTLRIPNCLYVRYIGAEENLKVAYEKLNVYSFEEEIPLKGDSYTVFVDELDNGDIIADVFMERLDG